MHTKKLVRFRIKKQFGHPVGHFQSQECSDKFICVSLPVRTPFRGNPLVRCSRSRRITSFCIPARGVERVRGRNHEREWLDRRRSIKRFTGYRLPPSRLASFSFPSTA